MRRCTKCVMPDTRPDVPFDAAGVCAACRSYEARAKIDWPERERQLERLLAEHRGRGRFDCVVASSGGKDSTYIASELLARGMTPLVVTATTCHLTPIGRRNIANLGRYATTIEYTPNRRVRGKLNRLGFFEVGDISWPEHAAIFTTPQRVAAAHGIRLVWYGECPQNAYGGPDGTAEQQKMSPAWAAEFGGFLGLRAADAVGYDGITERDMLDYTLDEETAAKVDAYFLGQFLPWNSHHNAQIALGMGMQYTGSPPCQASLWPWENLDNAQTGLHDHQMYRKYGYGRACTQASVDVRYGLRSRDEALELVRRIDGLFPNMYSGVTAADMLHRAGIEWRDMQQTLELFTAQDLFDGLDEGHMRPLLRE